jgi:serine/threonine-protein kinase
MNPQLEARPIRTIGRYAIFNEVASGGMATVHLGRLIGPVGFSRTVAIKRLHSHFAKDPEFAPGFVDEARLAARIHHPNVVPIIDVLNEDGELSLVMDYVEGESLARLLRRASSLKQDVPLAVVSAIMCGTLYGLHAAHEAVNERGEPMHLVHRDVSPQNVLVGSDGLPRLVDFGVAKAAQRIQTTAEGQVKGKVAYMAPEQLRGAEVTRQTDIYAAGVVIWELITGSRLFQSDNPAHLMTKILEDEIPPPSSTRSGCPDELDRIVMRATSRKLEDRYETAREMAHELQAACAPAPPTMVSDWMTQLAGAGLSERRQLRAFVESQEVSDDVPRAFIAAPKSAPQIPEEDLVTIADRPSRPVVEESKTVTRFSNAPIPERTRLLLPLVLGLLVVATTIIVVLALSAPPLAQDAVGESNLTDESTQLGSANTHAQPDLGSASPDSNAAHHKIPSDDQPAAPQETLDEQPQQLTLQAEPGSEKNARSTPGKAETGPAVCPKFYVDDEGIRRVNRKCWK